MTISPKNRVKHKNLRLDGEIKTVFQEGNCESCVISQPIHYLSPESAACVWQTVIKIHAFSGIRDAFICMLFARD
ncbi:hypothetical protein [Methylophilus sp. OH31]|uniref:hypothetical protein n=1 Tax=Methylophilus sp. OH31 TaxID=1387312 RepID=UPI0011DC78CB|nr:hypothetical protein [Methylophilus sp. OH31]